MGAVTVPNEDGAPCNVLQVEFTVGDSKTAGAKRNYLIGSLQPNTPVKWGLIFQHNSRFNLRIVRPSDLTNSRCLLQMPRDCQHHLIKSVHTNLAMCLRGVGNESSPTSELSSCQHSRQIMACIVIDRHMQDQRRSHRHTHLQGPSELRRALTIGHLPAPRHWVSRRTPGSSPPTFTSTSHHTRPRGSSRPFFLIG